MLAGSQPANLVTALADPLPSTVTGWLLDVPEHDQGFFRDRSTCSAGECPRRSSRARCST
jgi:hypothetical protein